MKQKTHSTATGSDTQRILDDPKINIKVKLAGLWTSLTLLFIYADYFGLYKPGWLQGMLEGRMGPLGTVTQEVLVGVSVLMAVPCVMVFLSLLLKPGINRWLNIILGAFYGLMMLGTMVGEWVYYLFFGTVEAVIAVLIVGLAWTWPKQEVRS